MELFPVTSEKVKDMSCQQSVDNCNTKKQAVRERYSLLWKYKKVKV